jgi:hypothetical protein
MKRHFNNALFAVHQICQALFECVLLDDDAPARVVWWPSVWVLSVYSLEKLVAIQKFIWSTIAHFRSLTSHIIFKFFTYKQIYLVVRIQIIIPFTHRLSQLLSLAFSSFPVPNLHEVVQRARPSYNPRETCSCWSKTQPRRVKASPHSTVSSHAITQMPPPG